MYEIIQQSYWCLSFLSMYCFILPRIRYREIIDMILLKKYNIIYIIPIIKQVMCLHDFQRSNQFNIVQIKADFAHMHSNRTIQP